MMKRTFGVSSGPTARFGAAAGRRRSWSDLSWDCAAAARGKNNPIQMTRTEARSNFDFMHEINKLEVSKENAVSIIEVLKDIDSIFGVLNFNKVDVPKEIQALADKREEARKNKDFATADKLRDEIKAKGYVLEDTLEGIRVKKK